MEAAMMFLEINLMYKVIGFCFGIAFAAWLARRPL